MIKFRKDLDALSGPNHFIKLKDGESVSGVCRGEIYEAFLVWDNKQKTEVPEGTPGAKFRFSVNFIVKDGSSYVAKILDGGTSIYKQLAALAEDYDITQTVVKITRQGNGLDTEYSVLPAPPKQQVTKEAMTFIETVELHKLGDNKPTPPTKVKNFAPGASDEPEF